MMNSMGERMKAVETEVQNLKDQNGLEHSEIKNSLGKIEEKLDSAINCKADKKEVEKSNDRIDKINDGLLTASRNALFTTIGLVFTALSVVLALIIALKK